MEPTKRCQLLLSICAVVLINLIFAIPQADAAFNEDFEPYANGQALNEGSNPNGWTAYDEDFTIRFSWFGSKTINGVQSTGRDRLCSRTRRHPCVLWEAVPRGSDQRCHCTSRWFLQQRDGYVDIQRPLPRCHWKFDGNCPARFQ